MTITVKATIAPTTIAVEIVTKFIKKDGQEWPSFFLLFRLPMV